MGLGNQPNPMKDVEVSNPPDDSISCLRFSPPSVTTTSFLIAGSWDNNVRCWEIQGNGQSVPKTQQSMQVRALLKIDERAGLTKLCYVIISGSYLGCLLA